MATDLISRQFQYLRDDYGFTVARAQDDLVEYESPGCRVMVGVDRGEVSVLVGTNEPQIIRRFRCSLPIVVLSRDPEFQFAHTYDPEAFTRDRRGTVERQLAEQADLLRRYCDDLLRGDWSRRGEIEQFLQRREEEFRRQYLGGGKAGSAEGE